MSRFLARRHRRLMDESEQALHEASQSSSELRTRVSKQILNDSKNHSLWESRHADLMVPVAEQSKPCHQIVMLRLMATRLVHGRAIVEYIRDNEIRGAERKHFFEHYFPQLNYDKAILSAHRYYLMSESSMFSTDHIIDMMFDPVSHQLLQQYSDVYKQYFKINSYMVTSEDSLCARALKPLAEGSRLQLGVLKTKLATEPTHSRCCEFEKQSRLARSGRYPVLNYLNA